MFWLLYGCCWEKLKNARRGAVAGQKEALKNLGGKTTRPKFRATKTFSNLPGHNIRLFCEPALTGMVKT
jgi:hypothetical protein